MSDLLICSKCGDVVDECFHCGREFEEDDEVFCDITGVHFCSEECCRAVNGEDTYCELATAELDER